MKSIYLLNLTVIKCCEILTETNLLDRLLLAGQVEENGINILKWVVLYGNASYVAAPGRKVNCNLIDGPFSTRFTTVIQRYRARIPLITECEMCREMIYFCKSKLARAHTHTYTRAHK